MSDGSKIPGSTSLSELRQSNADPFNKEFFKLYFTKLPFKGRVTKVGLSGLTPGPYNVMETLILTTFLNSKYLNIKSVTESFDFLLMTRFVQYVLDLSFHLLS